MQLVQALAVIRCDLLGLPATGIARMQPATILFADYRIISLNRINPLNDSFRITTREDVDDLAASIRSGGLISPLCVIKETSGYTIVSGFRRLAACQKVSSHDIPARILAPETSPLSCLRLAIAENALQRPLNLIEISRALQKLSKFTNGMEQLADTASSCGLPANHALIRKIRGLCLLPPAIQQGILNESIHLAMAGELVKLPDDIAVQMAGLFELLKLSLNKQREMMALISEIARRDDISMQQVLSHAGVSAIVHDEALDRAQKVRQLRARLRQWRFPRIVEAENHYHLHAKKLKLGQDIKLIPPKEFEGDTFSLVLSFKSIAQLKSLQSRLEQLIRHPSLAEIIEG